MAKYLVTGGTGLMGRHVVERVEGGLSHVIGLPLQRLFELGPEIAGKD